MFNAVDLRGLQKGEQSGGSFSCTPSFLDLNLFLNIWNEISVRFELEN